MLHIEHLVLNVGGHLLLEPGFDMRVEAGQTACLQGESGCGKTSLLKACIGLVDVAQGSIVVDGLRMNAATLTELRRRVAYLPQELALPAETVKEMVEMPFALAANEARRYALKQLPDELERLGLTADLLERRTASLSGGQRQRIMLCVAVLLGKQLLLLDEPTRALDPDAARIVCEYISAYCRRTGAAALMVSHDEDLVCDAHFTIGSA